MKKTLLKALIAVLALSSAGIAYAETSASAMVNVSASTTKPGLLQKIKDERTEVKGEIKDLRQGLASTTAGIRDEMKDKVKDNIKARTENRYTKMTTRFKATIDRETNIMTRINSRITKVKTDGKDTTESEKLTADAKIQLDAATAGLVTLTTEADAQASMENSSTTAKALRDGLTAMKKTAGDIEKNLRTAHNDLMKAVISLIKLTNGAKLQASSTIEVKEQN